MQKRKKEKKTEQVEPKLEIRVRNVTLSPRGSGAGNSAKTRFLL